MFFVRPDRARRPARGPRAVRAHRHRPHHAARQSRAAARRASSARSRRSPAPPSAPTRATCSCWSDAQRTASASSASARSRPRSDCSEPWYNYHVGTLVHASRALGVYTVAPTLFLANDHTGHTELCSLFLDQALPPRQERRAARRRAACCSSPSSRDRFAPKVIAELRGRLDADGRSPFWEGLGRHFFAMEYSTADYLTGIGQKAFIAELMPQASGVREPAAAGGARGDRRRARRHGAGARDARAGRLSLRRLRRHLRRGPDASNASATTSTRCATRRCCR